MAIAVRDFKVVESVALGQGESATLQDAAFEIDIVIAGRRVATGRVSRDKYCELRRKHPRRLDCIQAAFQGELNISETGAGCGGVLVAEIEPWHVAIHDQSVACRQSIFDIGIKDELMETPGVCKRLGVAGLVKIRPGAEERTGQNDLAVSGRLGPGAGVEWNRREQASRGSYSNNREGARSFCESSR